MAKIIIELEIDGDEQDALDVVESLLDEGVIQDAINQHGGCADAGPLEVTSAVCRVAT